MAFIVKTLTLFVMTALAEIIGCYLPYLYIQQGRTVWILLPATVSLGIFAWLLSFHPTVAAGRTYAAYGGVYVAVAIVWMWCVEGVRPDMWDCLGASLALLGMCLITFAPHQG